MGPPAIAPHTRIWTALGALVLVSVAAGWMGHCAPDLVMLPAFVLAAGAALALTPVAIHLSYRLGVLDHPDERKLHERPMPLLGGAAVLVAFSAAAVAGLVALRGGSLRALSPPVTSVLIAGAFIAGMGMADDKWGLKPGVRIVGQLAAVCLVMSHGVMMTFLPPTLLGKAGEVLLTVLWVVGITNAMNFLDGLDGLASGVAVVAALAFGAIAGMTSQPVVAVLSLSLAGAALGFFKHNFRPARVYLGDSGATFLGFVLACIGVLGDWGKPDHAEGLLNLFVPVIILGIPIYDTIYTTVYRFRTGLVHTLSEWAAYVGRDHLHHRLQHLGMRPARTCLFICLGGVALGLLAIILKTKGELDRYDKFLAVALTAIVFVGATILMELGKFQRRHER